MTGFAHPEFLVGTDWLAQHIQDPGVVVLDCTINLVPKPEVTYEVVPCRAEFERSHIAGAQFIDVSRDLSDQQAKIRFMRQSPADFAAAMRRFGISNTTRVVTYSTGNLWWASRVWWLLREFGHDNAAVLDGGYAKWAREGRPVETGTGTARLAGDFTVRQVRNLMADKAAVQAAMGNPAVCTLNALSAAQHTGGGPTNYGRPGRIAGSLNLPAGDLLDPATGCFLPPEELRHRLGAVGALDREVILYCGGGIAATADALALIMLGHERVRVYDASLNEWAPDQTLPMEVG